MLAPRLAVGLFTGQAGCPADGRLRRRARRDIAAASSRVAVQLPLRPRAAAALNVTVDARVVAPGPEGCHRSQVGWASRFPENPQAICSCPRGDLNSRFRGDTEGHTRASDLAIDLPHRLPGRARTASGVRPDSPAAASRDHSRAVLPPVHPCPLNTAAPPRRECARRGLDPIPPPNREDRTMTETVDQAQTRPPRALAGIIEDA
jgi:hypothetical protein